MIQLQAETGGIFDKISFVIHMHYQHCRLENILLNLLCYYNCIAHRTVQTYFGILFSAFMKMLLHSFNSSLRICANRQYGKKKYCTRSKFWNRLKSFLFILRLLSTKIASVCKCECVMQTCANSFLSRPQMWTTEGFA